MRNRSREEKVQPVGALLKRAMPPKHDVMEKLNKAAREWEDVVGSALGRQSAPLDIVNGELIVRAENPLVGNRVAMMGGNIARALMKQWNLEVLKVKVIVGRLPLKPQPWNEAYTLRPNAVSVREEDVKEFSSHCFESLPDFPEDAAESLARLRAFFLKRFTKNSG